MADGVTNKIIVVQAWLLDGQLYDPLKKARCQINNDKEEQERDTT
jgi:hypothetical protein